MHIEWDAAKAKLNRRKHGVSFDEAATVLIDPNGLSIEDLSSFLESRWVLIGLSSRYRVLAVAYTLRRNDRVRIISARRATKREIASYAKGI